MVVVAAATNHVNRMKEMGLCIYKSLLCQIDKKVVSTEEISPYSGTCNVSYCEIPFKRTTKTKVEGQLFFSKGCDAETEAAALRLRLPSPPKTGVRNFGPLQLND
ncbi:hypothetical protein ABEB36_000168 [Hypothenemus hampei]|uniref:Vitellogenin n=1 Tax=Hypothenemus hampei TaxID=57062 RepID=A0ABD1FD18_HYPHA